MQRALSIISIDGGTIDPKDYSDIQVYSSIYRSLPLLSFKIKDKNGSYWKKLDFSIGSVVEAGFWNGVMPEEGEKPQVLWTTKFNITKMTNNYEYDDTVFGGYIQVWCEQAWRFHGDYRSHAYPRQKIGQLILEISKQAMSRSENALYVDKQRFMKSADKGTVRYKTAQSDLEFIENTLMPIALSEQSNALFFVDRAGLVCFSSFNKLFSKKISLIVHPDIDGKGYDEELLNLLDKKNIKAHVPFLELKTSICANTQAINNIKRKLYLYDYLSESTILATQKPRLNLGSDSGSIVRGALPIKENFLRNTSNTFADYIPHRTIEDQLSLQRNNLIDTNDMFKCEITLPILVENVSVGDTVFLWTPGVKASEEDEDGNITSKDGPVQTHWLNGKWLISEEALISIDSYTVATKWTLIRPTFYISTDTTTLSNVDTFSKV